MEKAGSTTESYFRTETETELGSPQIGQARVLELQKLLEQQNPGYKFEPVAQGWFERLYRKRLIYCCGRIVQKFKVYYVEVRNAGCKKHRCQAGVPVSSRFCAYACPCCETMFFYFTGDYTSPEGKYEAIPYFIRPD